MEALHHFARGEVGSFGDWTFKLIAERAGRLLGFSAEESVSGGAMHRLFKFRRLGARRSRGV